MAALGSGCGVRESRQGRARAFRVCACPRHHSSRRQTSLLPLRGRRTTAQLHYSIQRETLQVRYRPNPGGYQALYAGRSEARALDTDSTSVRDSHASSISCSIPSHTKGASSSQSRPLRSRRAVRVGEDPLGAAD